MFLERIGLFGGTFNPIHSGHLHAANALKKNFPLDAIHMIPSALPPHKIPDNLAGASDRLEMLRLAAMDNPGLTVSEVELSRTGPSYTIDTIYHYKSVCPADTRLFWAVGVDAFLEIETWKSFRDLFNQIPFIVMSRPGDSLPNSAADFKKLKLFLKQTISDKYLFSEPKQCFFHPKLESVFFVDINPLYISSTDVRNRISKGRSILGRVPATVGNYIKGKGLYL